MAGQTDEGMCATKACQPMDYVLRLRCSRNCVLAIEYVRTLALPEKQVPTVNQ